MKARDRLFLFAAISPLKIRRIIYNYNGTFSFVVEEDLDTKTGRVIRAQLRNILSLCFIVFYYIFVIPHSSRYRTLVLRKRDRTPARILHKER